MQYLSFHLWLISFSTMFCRFIHVVANGRISPFLWLNNISLCVVLSVVRYHLFRICSFVDKYVGCFHNFAIVNNAAVHMWMWIFLLDTDFIRYWFHLNRYPDIEFLDHMVILYLIFWGNSLLFSIMATPIIYFHWQYRGFPFLHILAKTHLCSERNNS